MGGLNATERRAQAALEDELLARVVALSAAAGAVPAERVEQALGYYRHAAADNPVQQLLGRRLRAAAANLAARGLLDPAGLPETFRATTAGRAAVAARQRPWWRRLVPLGGLAR
jgi:hypothetical protein